MYATDENFSSMIRHIPALAFLPVTEIPAAFDILKNNLNNMNNIPEESEEGLDNLIKWFERNYVLGRERHATRSGTVIRSRPLFPPTLWSVVDNIEYALPRTQNSVEAWHRRWISILGNVHIGTFKMINEIQKEQKRVELDIESILRGAPRSQQKKNNRNREDRIQTIYNNHSNTPLMEYLRAIAHNISF